MGRECLNCGNDLTEDRLYASHCSTYCRRGKDIKQVLKKNKKREPKMIEGEPVFCGILICEHGNPKKHCPWCDTRRVN